MRRLLEPALEGLPLGLRVARLADGSGGVAFGGVRLVEDGARIAAVVLPGLLRVDLRLVEDAIGVLTFNYAEPDMQERFVDAGTESGMRVIDVWTAWADDADPLVSRTRLAIVDDPDLAVHHVLVSGSAWPAATRRMDNGPWYFPE